VSEGGKGVREVEEPGEEIAASELE